MTVSALIPKHTERLQLADFRLSRGAEIDPKLTVATSKNRPESDVYIEALWAVIHPLQQGLVLLPLTARFEAELWEIAPRKAYRLRLAR